MVRILAMASCSSDWRIGLHQIGLNTEFHAAGQIAPAPSRGEQNERDI